MPGSDQRISSSGAASGFAWYSVCQRGHRRRGVGDGTRVESQLDGHWKHVLNIPIAHSERGGGKADAERQRAKEEQRERECGDVHIERASLRQHQHGEDDERDKQVDERCGNHGQRQDKARKIYASDELRIQE